VYDVVDTYEESCAMTDEVDDDFGVARDLSPDLTSLPTITGATIKFCVRSASLISSRERLHTGSTT
jgi:hypothetical protein